MEENTRKLAMILEFVSVKLTKETPRASDN